MGFPETIFGFDTDEVFAYSTKKTVWIRDRWIGLLWYSLLLLIAIWVLGFQILYGNEHYKLRDVKGMGAVTVKQPTKDFCDSLDTGCKATFKRTSELDYCRMPPNMRNQSMKGGKAKHRRTCQRMSKESLFPRSIQDNKVFVPTAIEFYTQERLCDPTADDDCQDEYKLKGGPRRYFVADIEHFQLGFVSSYKRDEIVGASYDLAGHYQICSSGLRRTWEQRMVQPDCSSAPKAAIPCAAGHSCKYKHKDPPSAFPIDLSFKTPSLGLMEAEDSGKAQSASSSSAELPNGLHLRLSSAHRRHRNHHKDAPGHDRNEKVEANTPTTPQEDADDNFAFATAEYDVFRIFKLLRLAGLDLDESLNDSGESIREAGAVITIDALYNNLHAWRSSLGKHDVEYTYAVRESPMRQMKQEGLAEQQPDDFPNTRVIEVRHGLLIELQVTGSFGFFSIVYLLVMLTTSLALVAGASKITDMIATYLHPRRANYFHLKYEVSADFSDLWKCECCGYFNEDQHTTCHGMHTWERPKRHDMCRHPRPKTTPRSPRSPRSVQEEGEEEQTSPTSRVPHRDTSTTSLRSEDSP